MLLILLLSHWMILWFSPFRIIYINEFHSIFKDIVGPVCCIALVFNFLVVDSSIISELQLHMPRSFARIPETTDGAIEHPWHALGSRSNLVRNRFSLGRTCDGVCSKYAARFVPLDI